MTGSSPYYRHHFIKATNTSNCQYYVNQTAYTLGTMDTNRHVLDVCYSTAGTIIYDNNTITSAAGTLNNDGLNYFLFARNRGGTAETNNMCNMKVYSCYLKASGTYYTLIPCQRKSDDELGMYCIETAQFLTNSGSGSFTAGPMVDEY